MRRIAVLDAPSNLGLRPPTATSVPGCAKAPGALRDHGLLARLAARDAGCLTPPRYDAGDWRPGDGVAHAAQIAAYSRALADRIGAIIDAGEFPVVLGGDCSILIGSGIAMHRIGDAVGGRVGLVFVDGHSDFRHPGNASYVGAAAGEDLALVTGRGQPDLASIEGRRPYFRDVDVVVMGIRAQDEHRLDLQAAGIVTRPVPALRAEGAARSAQWARDQLVDCAGYWVHVDVDVLDPAVMPAVDAPSPGGIAFPELELLLAGLVESPHCLGVEITVFDPDYDPDGQYAAEITSAVAAGLAAARTVAARPDLIAARRDIDGNNSSRTGPGGPVAASRGGVASFGRVAATDAAEEAWVRRRAAADAESVLLAAVGMSDGPAGAREETAVPATTLSAVEEAGALQGEGEGDGPATLADIQSHDKPPAEGTPDSRDSDPDNSGLASAAGPLGSESADGGAAESGPAVAAELLAGGGVDSGVVSATGPLAGGSSGGGVGSGRVAAGLFAGGGGVESGSVVAAEAVAGESVGGGAGSGSVVAAELLAGGSGEAEAGSGLDFAAEPAAGAEFAGSESGDSGLEHGDEVSEGIGAGAGSSGRPDSSYQDVSDLAGRGDDDGGAADRDAGDHGDQAGRDAAGRRGAEAGHDDGAEQRDAEPGETEPGRAELGNTEPGRAELGEAGLGEAGLGEAEPGRAELGNTEPGNTEPGVAEPGETGLGETGLGRTEPGNTELGEAEPGKTELGRSEPGNTELGEAEPGKTELGGAELGGAELGGAELGSVGRGKVEWGGGRRGRGSVAARNGSEARMRLLSRPLGSAPLLDSEPLPATRPGLLRPRAAPPRGAETPGLESVGPEVQGTEEQGTEVQGGEVRGGEGQVSEGQGGEPRTGEGFSLPAQRPAFDVGAEKPADIA